MFLCDTHPTQKSYTLLSVIEQITQVVCIQKNLFTICMKLKRGLMLELSIFSTILSLLNTNWVIFNIPSTSAV